MRKENDGMKSLPWLTVQSVMKCIGAVIHTVFRCAWAGASATDPVLNL